MTINNFEAIQLSSSGTQISESKRVITILCITVMMKMRLNYKTPQRFRNLGFYNKSRKADESQNLDFNEESLLETNEG